MSQEMIDTKQKPTPDFNIEMTPAAIAAIKKAIAELDNPEDQMLRLSIEGGGCSGLAYNMDFDHEKGEMDRVFTFDDLKVVVDARSLLYLGGVRIDFSDKLLGGGFKFENPRAKRACGCGTSFSV